MPLSFIFTAYPDPKANLSIARFQIFQKTQKDTNLALFLNSLSVDNCICLTKKINKVAHFLSK